MTRIMGWVVLTTVALLLAGCGGAALNILGAFPGLMGWGG